MSFSSSAGILANHFSLAVGFFGSGLPDIDLEAEREEEESDLRPPVLGGDRDLDLESLRRFLVEPYFLPLRSGLGDIVYDLDLDLDLPRRLEGSPDLSFFVDVPASSTPCQRLPSR